MPQLPRYSRLYTLAGAALVLIVVGLGSVHLLNGPQASADGDLLHYRLHGVTAIDGIDNNLSGITWNADTQTLFAIVNSPTLILELDPKGAVLRRIYLHNFVDTEGIVHISGRLFAVVQERQRRISYVEINRHTSEIDATAWPYVEIAGTPDNHALEGIAWSPRSGLFIAEEKSPRRIHTLAANSLKTAQTTEAGEFSVHLPVRDIAGLHLDQIGNTLLAVSEESNQLLQYSLDGHLLSTLSLSRDPFGLWPFMEQPEGVAMDDSGKIYLVGEPNQLAVLQKTGKRRKPGSLK